MIRILHVIDRLKRVSGIARSILNYYEHIDTNRIQFDFLVVDSDDDIVKGIRQKGGDVYTIEKLGLTNGGIVKKEIEDFFSDHKDKYQIIHSSFYHIDFILFPIAKKNGVSICISHSHNTQFSDYWMRSIRNCLMAKMSLKHATHYVACSSMAGEFQFGKKRVKSGNVYILKNAIDAKEYEYNPAVRESVRDQLGLNDKYVIGNVGRFNKQKNHQYLINLFYEYAKTDESAVLLLVGEGELMEQFEREVQDKNIEDKVLFLGARKDVPHILQAMDCYVFPSLYEGLGISLVEAQAAGLPCIASSTIPEESKVTDNVVYLDFSETTKWVETIKSSKEFRRSDTFEDIAKAGYEIGSAARMLEDYYESLL